jgi:anti-anti-sigma regulatory factor
MADTSKTVFRVERADDALVVIPTGDHIGFEMNQVQKETDSIVADVKSSVLAGVIFDAAEASYLSSTIIGAMIRLWDAATEIGAKFVLCGLSDDAMSAIVATRLDTKWPSYETRAEALKAVR